MMWQTWKVQLDGLQIAYRGAGCLSTDAAGFRCWIAGGFDRLYLPAINE